MRKVMGFVLRLPLVVLLTILWTFTIWPLIVVWNLIALVLVPAAYIPLFVITWIQYSFLGTDREVLPDYWKTYPDEIFKNMETGFPTLKKWLLEGVGEYSEDSGLFGCAGCGVWLVLIVVGFASCAAILSVP